jgi:DNA-binding transcriptional MerR regulator
MTVSVSLISIPGLTRSNFRRIVHVEAHFKSSGGLMSDLGGLMAIGELARRSGLASSAVRYYERVGLLSPAGRAGGRRRYLASSAERLALIQLCQDAGFTLREIRALIAGGSRKTRPWTRLVEAKLRELETRIAQAERAKVLVQHALACPHRNLLRCSNFRAAIKAQLGPPGRDAVTRSVRRASPV